MAAHMLVNLLLLSSKSYLRVFTSALSSIYYIVDVNEREF